MRKEDVASLIIYFIMIGIAIIVGLTVIQDLLPVYGPQRMDEFLFMVLNIVVGLIINVVFLEVCHAIGAIIGGYSVVSFNVLGFCLEKKEGKWKFHFKDFDGLSGETKIAIKKEKHSLKPYVWLPIFAYALEIACCIVIYSSITSGTNDDPGRWLALSSIVFIIISSMLALYNLVPIKLDSMTDGYRLVLLSKQVNIDAYNELLRIEDLERNNKEVKDIKVFEEITEFTANLNLISVYHNLNQEKYDDAEKLIDLMIANPKKIDPKTYNRLVAQKVYIELLTHPVEDAAKVYDDLAKTEIRRFIANDCSMESIRSYILIAGLIEQSRGEVEYAKSKLNKATKNTLPTRVAIEKKMYENALEKVYKAHPDWEKENTAD